MNFNDPLTLITLDEVDSTNAFVKRELPQYLNHLPCFVLARKQTGGRGRDQREWDSPEGGFYGTLALELPVSPILSYGLLSLLAGLGIRDVLAKWLPGERLDLKWPNDLLCRGKKLAGILVENQVKGSDWLSLWGIGINLNRKRVPFPSPLQAHAIALSDLGIEAPSPIELAGLLYRGFAYWLEKWHKGEGGHIQEALQEATLSFKDQPISVHEHGVLISGIFDGIDGQGGLRLRIESGEIRTCYCGEIGDV